MFYVSMIGEVKGRYERNGSYPIVFDTEGCEIGDISVKVHNEEIRVGASTEGEEIFGLVGGDDYAPTAYKGAKDFLNSELADTEENPLIIVCTKGLRFYKNTPCLIRILFVNDDMMLVELVYGSCEFQFADGTFTALQRCDNSDLNTKVLAETFDCKGLKHFVYNKTEGGWDKSYDMVNPMCLLFENSNSYYRFLGDNAYIFNEARIKEREAKEEEEKLMKKMEMDLKKELAEKHLEEARQYHLKRDREAAEAKARKAAEARNAKRAEKEGQTTVSRSVSAADFLSAVAKA